MIYININKLVINKKKLLLLMDTIPKELNNKIYNYIIYPQPKLLLNDIINFNIIKENIINIFIDYYNDYNTSISWLLYELIYFCNDYSYFDNENHFTIKLFEIISRNLSFNIKYSKNINIYFLNNYINISIYNLIINDNNNKLNLINKILALLTIDERHEFIDYVLDNFYI